MGGKQSKDVTRTDIQNETKIQIENINKNLTDIINNTITESTMNVINENAQEMDAASGASNLMNLEGGIKMTGNSELVINQEASVDSVMKAVMNLTQDTTAVNNLANKINDDIMNKISNDSTAKQALESATAVNSATKTAGGMADMLNSVTDLLGKMVPGNQTVTKENITNIKNTITTNIKNTTVNETHIATTIKNTITNNITTTNTGTCKINTVAENVLNLKGGVEMGGNAKVKIGQSAKVKAMTDCIIGAVQTTKLVQDLTNENTTNNKTDTENKNTTEQKAKTDATVTKTTETGSALENMFSSIADSFSPVKAMGNFIALIVVICICISLIGGVAMYFNSKGSGSGSDASASE